jgi:hypothetical protein
LEQDKNELEHRLTNAFKYIGSVNIQIEEIKSTLSDIKKYPENKKDFKYIFQYLSEKVLSIIDADWVLIRIIEISTYKTLREHCATRGRAVLLKYQISNKEIMSDKLPKDFSLVNSTAKNFTISTCCVIPKPKLTEEQTVMTKAVINQLEMLFLIFASSYYKNSRITHQTKGNNKI